MTIMDPDHPAYSDDAEPRGQSFTKTRRCFNCGEIVTDKDYDYIGHQSVYVCGLADCEKEVRDANRGVQEEAAWDAARDSYERYW